MINWLFRKRDRRVAKQAAERAAGAFMQRYSHLIKASYDGAASDSEFSNWWANADNYSAKRANSLAVRKKLRERARYEYANNPFAKGIIDTRANDTIGTGPRLQLQLRNQPQEAVTSVEEAWATWARSNKLADKLRTMVKSLGYDGEPFGLMTTGRQYGVTLGIRLVECDQFTDPTYYEAIRENWCDGIHLSGDGEPISYRMMKYHPGGDDGWGVASSEYKDVPADGVLHLFRKDRAGQYRGIPDITPALTLFAALRRYRNAVLAAAETAASFAAVIKTSHPGGFDDTVTPFDELEMQHGMMPFMPVGWDVSQLKAEQPSTTYEMFLRAILMEIARCLNMPFSKAAGYTADYTYASGKIEERDYESDRDVDRDWIGVEIVDRLFGAWWQEATLQSIRAAMHGDMPILPQSMWEMDVPRHVWHWDHQEHLDPAKAANSIATKLSCGATTIPMVYAEQGKDADVEMQRQADFLGLPIEEVKQRLADQIYSDSLSIAQQANAATQQAAEDANNQ